MKPTIEIHTTTEIVVTIGDHLFRQRGNGSVWETKRTYNSRWEVCLSREDVLLDAIVEMSK